MYEITMGRIGAEVDPAYVRILVDRLWPRGIRREGAPWDLWLKEIAPSTALRKWYNHDPERYAGFRAHYWEELTRLRAGVTFQQIFRILESQPVVLLTATHDISTSQVPILRDFLEAIRTETQ